MWSLCIKQITNSQERKSILTQILLGEQMSVHTYGKDEGLV